MTKELIIIAGANGVGKTTFGKPFVKNIGIEFLNADEIAKQLESERQKNIMVKAGRKFFARLQKAIFEEVSIVIETTLSGSYVRRVAQKAKMKGYKIRVIYIYVDDDDLCVERVKSRVLKGGHDVPEEDIRRRFQRSLHKFWNEFTSIADRWLLLYNGEEHYQQVAIGEEGEL